MRVRSLSRQFSSPRASVRFAIEVRSRAWFALMDDILRTLVAIKAHVSAHAAGFTTRRLLASLGGGQPRPPHFKRPSTQLTPKAPHLEVDRSRELLDAAATPRRVFVGRESAGGTEVAVAVIPQVALVPQQLRGRPLIEHLHLEVSMSRALADHCGFFTRALGLLESPPSLRQREHEVHLAFEITPALRPLPELLSTHGPLRSMTQLNVLSHWARQLLLALEAAHELGIVLRILRLAHVLVSDDGQRVKLGPSALADFALTDGSEVGGGRHILSANDLPPTDGPLSAALSASRSDGREWARASPSGASRVGASLPPPLAAGAEALSRSWAEDMLRRQEARPPALPEASLPPELLARTLLPGKAAVGMIGPSCDVWHVGALLFEMHSVVAHCDSLAVALHEAAPQILNTCLQPLPSHHLPPSRADAEGAFVDDLIDEIVREAADKPVCAPHVYDPFGDVQPAEDEKGSTPFAAPPTASQSDDEAPTYMELISPPSSRPPAPPPPPLPVTELEERTKQVHELLLACLQPHPDARPTIRSLLASPFIALDQTMMLAAKRDAAQHMRLALPSNLVERELCVPLRELQRLAAVSGKLPVHSFVHVVHAAFTCCSEPLRVMLAGGFWRLAKEKVGSFAVVADEKPKLAAEAAASRDLVAEVIERRDIIGCMRHLAINDFHDNAVLEGVDPKYARNEPRTQPVMVLARCLRQLISNADLDSSLLRPHCKFLLRQAKLCLDVGRGGACDAEVLVDLSLGNIQLRPGSAPPLSISSAPLALAFTRSWAAGPALHEDASPPAAAGAQAELADHAALYASAMERGSSSFHYYAGGALRRWSPALQSVLQQLLDSMLGGGGAGSFALPSLREIIATEEKAPSEEEVALDGAEDRPPHADAAEADGLTQGYLAELTNAQLSLKGLQGAGESSSMGRRRVRCSALAYFATLVQKPKALRLCIDIQLPQHASAALLDPEAEVRAAAFELFLCIAQLEPSDDPAEAAPSADLLYSCFAQHALMHKLVRPLHSPHEAKGVLDLAVRLLARLEARQDARVMEAMRRARAWHALVKLLPPARIDGERQLVNLHVRRIFESVARHGNPPALAYLWAHPPLLRALREQQLTLPAAPTLLALGREAYELLVEEGDIAPDEIPPPAPPPPAPEGAAAYAPLHDGDEAQLLRHACSCLRQPYPHLGGDAPSRRTALHALITLATRRAERALRELRAVDEAYAASASAASAASLTARARALCLSSDGAAPPPHAPHAAFDGCVELVSLAARLARRAAAAELRVPQLLLESGVVEWVVRTALPPPRPAAADEADEAARTQAVLFPSFARAAEADELLGARPLAHAAQLPLARAQRAAAAVLASHILPRLHPPVEALLRRLRLGEAVVLTLQQQQQQLNVALSLAHPPPLFLEEYAPARAARMRLWAALLAAPPAIARLLVDAHALERLVVHGALPVLRAFHLTMMRLPPAFLPFNFQMALRHEALEMMRRVVHAKAAQPAVFERLLQVLHRERVIEREVSRLRPLVGGARPQGEPQEREYASAVTLLMVLDEAADTQLWQMMGEAGASEVVFEIHMRAKDVPPARVERLLHGLHRMQRPLGRAAAGFVHRMRRYEEVKLQPHPLITAAIRADL
ncbi:hypothetical protein AB1Y20_006889 [Prymnesium parvum]|uniref:Protein kinase domain-containing protein n=1 Tax=Prymnesium parvum TaxID=97485 RepID=A0AB34IZA4_PRYPA